MNWQERAEKAEDVLRSLASFVGAGGYNANKVDADMFEQKIRWGIGQITERLEKAEAELAKAREQRDGLAAKLAELCEQKPVVKYMSRRLTPVGTKEMWGYDLVDGLPDGTMLYASPVQMPVVADCRTCKNKGRTNGLSQESFCESCVWQLMSFRKNHYAPNSPDFEGIKMLELPKNDAAPVPAVAAPAVPVSIDAAADRLLEGGE